MHASPSLATWDTSISWSQVTGASRRCCVMATMLSAACTADGRAGEVGSGSLATYHTRALWLPYAVYRAVTWHGACKGTGRSVPPRESAAEGLQADQAGAARTFPASSSSEKKRCRIARSRSRLTSRSAKVGGLGLGRWSGLSWVGAGAPCAHAWKAGATMHRSQCN